MAESAVRAAKRIVRNSVQQWTPGIRPSWSVSRVQTALVLHQQGMLTESAMLVEAMLADDEIPSSMGKALDLIVGSPFSMFPVDESAAAKAIAEKFHQSWPDVAPELELKQLLCWWLMLGVAVGTLDWSTGETWEPRLRVLHPQFLRWDGETIGPDGNYGSWFYMTRSGEEQVIPDDGRWVLIGNGRSGLINSGVRALAGTWLGKQYTWRDWNRYNERHGLPIVKAMVPAFADDTDKTEFIDDLGSLGSDTTAFCPTNLDENGAQFDVNLIEAKDSSWETFQKTVERADRKIQIFFNGSNAGSELASEQGSRAASESSNKQSTKLGAARCRIISTSIRSNIVKPWAAFADSEALAPWPTWAVEPPDDITEKSNGWSSAANAVSAWANAGYSVENVNEIAEDIGLRLSESNKGTDDDDDDDDGLTSSDLTSATADDAAESMRYVTGIAEVMAEKAAKLDDLELESLESILLNSTGPKDLRIKLQDYAGSNNSELAGLFEHAVLASQLAGRESVLNEDEEA